jgi:omega-6 fatty acid desaturase (delta-12 desaturase)
MDKEDRKEILSALNTFCDADNQRAVLELFFTLTTFFILFSAMLYSLSVSYWLVFILLIPTGIMLTRIFTIQHDCGHYSFFSSLKANNILGGFLGVLTLTPYYYWRKTHNFHHAFSGNLDKRGIGDLDTLTITEYQNLSFFKKIRYRIYRNPVMLLVIGPIALFGLKHRFPIDNPFHSIKSWLNIALTNLGIAVIVVMLVHFFGWEAFFFVYLPVSALASSIGVALFFIHHQYEDMYWDRDDKWSYFDAGLYGSSYFEFSNFPSWLVANINLHHIHHLNGRIPFYRLRECLDAVAEMQNIPKRGFKDIPECFKLALWDEDNRKMVGFSALNKPQL